METTLHRKILLYSAITAAISIIGIFMIYLLNAEIFAVFILFLAFSIISAITAYAMKFRENRKFRTIARISVYLFPLITFGGMWVPYGSIFLPVTIAICIMLGIAALIHVFAYSVTESFKGITILLILIVTGIFFKKQHWLFSGIIVSASMAMTSLGSIMYGVRCLYLEQKDKYFRRLVLYGNIIIALALLAQMFKMQHWPGSYIFLPVGFGLLIIGTVYVLMTIQSSGFIDWQPLYRKILRNILIPWAFVFLLYAARYMVPELNNLLFTSETTRSARIISPYGFGMKDYVIGDKMEIKP